MAARSYTWPSALIKIDKESAADPTDQDGMVQISSRSRVQLGNFNETKMSLVNLVQVEILNNPSGFFDPFQFEITFEVIAELQQGADCPNKDIEFKLVYVGSAAGSENDQILESVMVGPVPVGVSKFVLEAPVPNIDLIPASDLVGLTVILLSCAYAEKEFIRVGYYVNNDYVDEELRENPPAQPDLQKIQRHILAEKPRVTRFAIPWDQEESMPPVVDEALIEQEEEDDADLMDEENDLEEDDNSEQELEDMEESNAKLTATPTEVDAAMEA